MHLKHFWRKEKDALSNHFGVWSSALGRGKRRVGYKNVEVMEGIWALKGRGGEGREKVYICQVPSFWPLVKDNPAR